MSGSGSVEHGDGASAAFVAGRVRDELGLMSADLTVGLEVARNLLRRGAGAEALRVYAGLVLCEPANVAFQMGLANCALQIGEAHLALQAASVVIALDPRNARDYYLSGRACIGLGSFAEAREDFGDAISFGREVRDAAVVEEARRLLQTLPADVPGLPAAAG